MSTFFLQIKPRTGLWLLLTMLLIGCEPKEKAPPPISENTIPPSPTFVPAAVDSFFAAREIIGSFVFYDLEQDRYHVYNDSLSSKRYPPASTFKILNALIALETGVIKDTLQEIPWDGKKRGWNKWNQSQTLATAMEYSALWAFQEIARRVQAKDSLAYSTYLSACRYGNEQLSGKIDLFWLNNSLQISPMEQIDFLVRLYQGELPFSKRNLELTQGILRIENREAYQMSGKTGWGIVNDLDIGWYVGYIERNEKVYFYATVVENAEEITSKGGFKRLYMELTDSLLSHAVNNWCDD